MATSMIVLAGVAQGGDARDGVTGLHADGAASRASRRFLPAHQRRQGRPPPRSASKLIEQYFQLAGRGPCLAQFREGAGRQAELHRHHGPSPANDAFGRTWWPMPSPRASS